MFDTRLGEVKITVIDEAFLQKSIPRHKSFGEEAV